MALLIKHVEHVLAVWRHDSLLKAHPPGLKVKRLDLAALQHKPRREDHAVALWQLNARLNDGVLTRDGLGQAVEDQPAPLVLAVGQDLEHDERAHLGVLDLGVAKRLLLLVHRLGVDPRPALCVVLDLDGQVAPDGLHEHLVQDVHVRERPLDVLIARGRDPLEVVRGAHDVVAITGVVDVADVVVGVDAPAQHARILKV